MESGKICVLPKNRDVYMLHVFSDDENEYGHGQSFAFRYLCRQCKVVVEGVFSMTIFLFSTTKNIGIHRNLSLPSELKFHPCPSSTEGG